MTLGQRPAQHTLSPPAPPRRTAGGNEQPYTWVDERSNQPVLMELVGQLAGDWHYEPGGAAATLRISTTDAMLPATTLLNLGVISDPRWEQAAGGCIKDT